VRLRDRTPTLDAVVRDVWTDDLLHSRAPYVWFSDNGSGPPWVLWGYCGDRIRFAQVDLEEWFIRQATIPTLMEEIDSLIAEAVNNIRSVRISTSEALVAGERRRMR
jgi:hypothetical protein